jgi:hypothetical protein
VTTARCPACGGPGILDDRDGQVHFHCRDCGASFREKRGMAMTPPKGSFYPSDGGGGGGGGGITSV